mgnify:CR=1 FL=1|jgi:glycosyltransferase involved in cell wall biosynthesis
MRILIVNQDATIPPRGYGGRSFNFYNKLSELGHVVELMCASNTHLYRKNIAHNATVNRDIIKVPTLKYSSSSSPLRILNWFIFMIYQVLFGLRCWFVSQKYDVVYYSSPSLLGSCGGFILSKLTSSKFVFEFRDIWPLTLIEIGKHNEKSIPIKLFKQIERFMILRADLVISPLPGSAKYARDVFGRVNGVINIPNGVDLFEIDQVKQELGFLHIQPETFNIAYAGSLGQGNRVDLLIEIAREIERKNFKIVIHVAGSGQFSSEVRKASENLNSLNFYGSLTKNDSIKLVKSCNASIILWHFRKLYKYGIAANKLFEYMACSSPIISIYDGYKDPVLDNSCGISLSSNSPLELTQLINDFCMAEKGNLSTFGNNGRNAAQNYYNYNVLAKKLEKYLYDIIN